MKLIYRAFVKGTNWALAGLMALLGFACSDDADDVAPEYGTPYAKYKIYGNVKNMTGEVVPDIKIEVMTSDDALELPLPVLSNRVGIYSTQTYSVGRVKQLKVLVSDIDKEINGSYQNDTILVNIEDKDYYFEGDGWNSGEAAKEVNIVLKQCINEKD